ncbi:trissin receptor-like, partial [Actinia tenebrosa]|uniref:Trissin receptor-like n=1 Tax=Actinia tenebrosa TaxID=6105 RepID=A0A6P8HJ19_ACTTE
MSAMTVQEIVFAVLFSVVLVFNIAGNSLVIYIITNGRGMKTSTNYLLLNLAVADILCGVFLTPKFIIQPFFRHSVPDGVLGEWLCKLLLFCNIAWMASSASIFTMVCLSVERYFAVCRPHNFRQRFSPKIVKVLVMVSWIYAVVVASPTFVFTHFSRESFACDMNIPGHSIFILIES